MSGSSGLHIFTKDPGTDFPGPTAQIHPTYEFLLRRAGELETLSSDANRLLALLSRHNAPLIGRWSLPSPVFYALTDSLGQIRAETDRIANSIGEYLDYLVSIMLEMREGSRHVPAAHAQTALRIISESLDLDRRIREMIYETSLISDCIAQRGVLHRSGRAHV